MRFDRSVTVRGSAAPLLLAALAGVLLGVGLFTFGYARGASYLTNDPAACGNCHVMRENVESWMKSSHGKVAVCNDCHTPPGLIGKYTTKAVNGFFHSLAFTTQRFPDEIYITQRNFRVTERACLKCHADMVGDIRATRKHGQEVSCISCHRTVGHM
jgi:cytochrome c nitrite reductase small subunit